MTAKYLSVVLLLLFTSPLLHSYSIFDVRRWLAVFLCSIMVLLFTLQRNPTNSLYTLFRYDTTSLALLALPFSLFAALCFGLSELRLKALSLSIVYSYTLAIIILGLVTIEASRSPYALIRTFQRSALLISTIAIVQFLGSLLAAVSNIDGQIRGTELFIYFEHPRFFSQIVPPLFLLAACSASLNNASTRRTIGCSTIACLFLVCGLGAQGAGPTYALIFSTIALVALLVVLRCFKTIKQLSLPITLMIGAALIHAALTVWVYGGDIGAVSTSDSGRIELWRKTLLSLVNRPISGFGPGSFPLVVEHSTAAHPHNVVLQLWIEGGLFSVLALTVFVVTLYSRVTHQIARTNDGSDSQLTLVILIWIVTAMLIHAMVSGVALMPISQLLLICMLGTANGVCLGQYPSWRNRISSKNIHYAGFGTNTISMIGIWIIIIGGLAFTTKSYTDGRYCKYIESNRELGPSFWGHQSCP